MVSPDESWMGSSAKAISEMSVGALFREEPSRLLSVLDGHMREFLAPELNGEKATVPLFPGSVSLRDMNDFYGLLECEIFSNYINLFLNLPCFTR